MLDLLSAFEWFVTALVVLLSVFIFLRLNRILKLRFTFSTTLVVGWLYMLFGAPVEFITGIGVLIYYGSIADGSFDPDRIWLTIIIPTIFLLILPILGDHAVQWAQRRFFGNC